MSARVRFAVIGVHLAVNAFKPNTTLAGISTQLFETASSVVARVWKAFIFQLAVCPEEAWWALAIKIDTLHSRLTGSVVFAGLGCARIDLFAASAPRKALRAFAYKVVLVANAFPAIFARFSMARVAFVLTLLTPVIRWALAFKLAHEIDAAASILTGAL